MSDADTPRPDAQADGLEELSPRAPDSAEQGSVKGGGGVIEDRSLSTVVMGDGSVRLADGSVRPPSYNTKGDPVAR